MSETLIEYDDLLDVTDHHWRNRLIGLFFGIYPAFRASRLNPIEALRTE